MLAYVFWHWPLSGIPAAKYEEKLRGFHSALAHKPAKGYFGSAVFAAREAPWLPSTVGYEDWYLLSDFADLGKLNDAAISGQRKAPHEDVARLARGGTGGVYRLLGPQPSFDDLHMASWLSKPSGMSYDQLYQRLRPWTKQPGVSLWQRQMTLGPTPEFCIHGAAKVALPEKFAPIRVSLVPVLIDVMAKRKRRSAHA